MAKYNENGLTDRQQQFCDEYMIDLNATQAAIRAGYSAKTANEQAARLLAKVSIKKYIDERRAAQTKRTEIEADWILERLKELAERCMQHEPVMERRDGEMVETGEYMFDSSGANRALELLGKHKKLWTDKVEVSEPAHETALNELERLKKKHAATADQS